MIAERKVDVFGFVTRIRAQRCQMVQTDVSVTSLLVMVDVCLCSTCSSPLFSPPTDAVRVHLPGFAWALPVRRHRAGGDLTGVPPGQALCPLTWSWLQWSGGRIQGLAVCSYFLSAFTHILRASKSDQSQLVISRNWHPSRFRMIRWERATYLPTWRRTESYRSFHVSGGITGGMDSFK